MDLTTWVLFLAIGFGFFYIIGRLTSGSSQCARRAAPTSSQTGVAQAAVVPFLGGDAFICAGASSYGSESHFGGEHSHTAENNESDFGTGRSDSGSDQIGL